MKHVACIICGQNRTEPFETSTGFYLVRCLNDGLVYVNPQPDASEIQRFYEDSTYFTRNGDAHIGYSDYMADKPAIVKNGARIIQKIKKICPKGRFFDMGCAYGFALDVARREGFEVFGNDLNAYAVAYAKDVLGLEHVRKGYVQNLEYPSGFFDVVTMFGTIEHFQDPRQELLEAYQLLARGGVLVILTVDFDSLIGRGTIRVPEHLYYFGAKSMRTFLEMNDFEIVMMKPRFGFNIFYFTVEDFVTRLHDYFYRLTDSSQKKKVLARSKRYSLAFIRWIGLGNWLVPGIDGQFLTIARKR